jgi:hypothetical protein
LRNQPRFGCGASRFEARASGIRYGHLDSRRRFGLDARDYRVYLHRLAFLDEDLGQQAARGGGNVGVDLVCRDLEQVLIALDGIAHALEPLRERSFRDRLAHLRHDHVDFGHMVLPWSGFAGGAWPPTQYASNQRAAVTMSSTCGR